MATIEEPRELPRNYWIAGLLGAYACIVAASPSPTLAMLLAAPLMVAPGILWLIQNSSRWLWCFFFAALLLPPLPFALGDSGPHAGVAVAAAGLLCGALRPCVAFIECVDSKNAAGPPRLPGGVQRSQELLRAVHAN